MTDNCSMSQMAVTPGNKITRSTYLLVWLSLAYVLHSVSICQGGVIDGVVINGTQNAPVGEGVEVVLRVPFNGSFVVGDQTRTERDGTFRFDEVPTDVNGPILPGANLGEIHFPGARVDLSHESPVASVTIYVYESSSGPSPLVAERHDVTLEPGPGRIVVRETIVVDNPSSVCYVGQPRHQGGGPVTLELKIPRDFEKITFDREGFGRAFHLINDKLVTGLPWPPGRREMSFTYIIANQDTNRAWQRELDLPTSSIQVVIENSTTDPVASSLPRLPSESANVRFGCLNESLPKGHLVEVRLDDLPVDRVATFRWVAVALLVGLTIGACVVGLRGRQVDHT